MSKVGSIQDKRQRKLFSVIAILIALDQLSKLWVRNSLSVGQSLPEEGNWRLIRVINSGSAFGLPIPQPWLVVFSILIIVGLLLLYYRYPAFDKSLPKIALGLLVGGAMSNLVDRLCFGYVTDFIDLHLWGDFHWPTFNLADCAIVLGFFLLAISLLSCREYVNPN
jgi:signal peptidase II